VPYPNFHAARIRQPNEFVEGSIRTLSEGLPKGIMMLVGTLKEGGKSETQAVRFPRGQWTVEQAQAWLGERKIEPIEIEKATNTGDSDDDWGEMLKSAADSGIEIRTHIGDSFADLARPVKRADGTLLMHGTLAKPGILLYADGHGSMRRELVTEECLRDRDWLRSVARAPATLEHPVRDGALVDVTPENFQVYGVGDADGDIMVDEDDFVRIKLAVRRKDAIDSVTTGDKVELSPGYDCAYDPTPGRHPVHGEYDGQQLARRCNHIAITSAARGGHDIGLRADSGVMVMTRRDSTPTGGTQIMNEKLLKALLALGVPRADAEKAARADSLEGFVDQLTESTKRDGATVREMYDELAEDFRKAAKDRDRLQGQCDQMGTELAKLKEETAADKKGDSAEERLAWFKERTDLMTLATQRKVDSADTLDNESLLRAVVKADNADLPDDATVDYLRGALDYIRRDAKEPAKGNPWAPLSVARQDAAPKPPTREQRQDADPFAVQEKNIRTAGQGRK